MCHIVAHFLLWPIIINIDNITGDEKTISAKRECQSDIYTRLIFGFYVLFIKF